MHLARDFVFFNEVELYKNANNCTERRREIGIPSENFYKLHTPFLMDSQLAKYYGEKEGTSGKERKRKRPSKTTKPAPEFLLEDCRTVERIYEEFRASFGPQLGSAELPLTGNGNSEAKDLVRRAPGMTWSGMTATKDTGTGEPTLRVVQIGTDETQAHGNSSPLLFRNEQNKLLEVEDCLVPPNSSFLLGDFLSIQLFPEHGIGKFDFILLDPPWSNRTVKRQKTYHTFDGSDFVKRSAPVDGLFSLPMSDLLAPGALLCIWLTNSQTVHQLAGRLIERWKLAKLARWYWLKICLTGQTVCPFRPDHKVPFESVLLACREEDVRLFSAIPDTFCLISLPNAFPSRKPPISLLLTQMGLIKPVNAGLEIFARYLLPNFVSVGFEAIKFQHVYYNS